MSKEILLKNKKNNGPQMLRLITHDDFSIKRRKVLLDNMERLLIEEKNCHTCSGVCCTFEFNSMQITPLEAIEVIINLEELGLLSVEMTNRLLESVEKYRLDKEISDGKGRYIRRYYTCPFFKHESLGCRLSAQTKPLGCLSFNPLKKGVKSSGSCSVYKSEAYKQDRLNLEQKAFDILIPRSSQRYGHREVRLELQSESELTQILKSDFEVYWNKRSIPFAVLSILERFEVKLKENYEV